MEISFMYFFLKFTALGRVLLFSFVDFIIILLIAETNV